MRKTPVVLVGTAMLIAACGGTGASPDIVIPTSSDQLERADYSDAQVQVYKDSLVYETLRLNTVEGMTFDTDVADDQWEPYVVRAKAFCDDARSSSWSEARNTYAEQVKNEAINAMPPEALELGDFDDAAGEILASLVDTQLRAIAADGSLCPELAPPGFEGTVIDNESEPTPEGEPILDGQYFGEGCEGAGNALLKLLSLLEGIEDGSTDVTTFEDDIINVASGLRYASLTESDSAAAQEMDRGVESLVELLIGLKSGDVEEFGAEVQAVSEQAITIIEVCGLS